MEEFEEFFFEKLKVYQEARMLVKTIYFIQKKFPVEERYELGDQIRRAVTSVTSNIAEGVSRMSDKEKTHFLDIAYGSLMETYSQLQLALDLDYITENDYKAIKPKIYSVSKLLLSFKNSILRKVPNT